jgi:tight adherence protein C
VTDWLLPGFGAFIALAAIAGLLLLRQMRRQARLSARIRTLHGQPFRQSADPEALRKATLQAVTALGDWILQRGLLPAGTRAELELLLGSSGQQASNGIGLFIGSKILLALCLPALALALLPGGMLPASLTYAPPLGLAILGLVLPDYLLGRRRKSYLRKLDAGLADALDVMVICTQAGIGMAAAIVQVGTELAHAHPEISREFGQTANELHMSTDSRMALVNLGRRTGLDGFRRLAATLVQTQQYGTPIVDALRALSAEMRQETLIRFEARAARIGVLLTLPTLVFIMPCVFLIAGGPAAIQIIRTLGHH